MTTTAKSQQEQLQAAMLLGRIVTEDPAIHKLVLKKHSPAKTQCPPINQYVGSAEVSTGGYWVKVWLVHLGESKSSTPQEFRTVSSHCCVYVMFALLQGAIIHKPGAR